MSRPELASTSWAIFPSGPKHAVWVSERPEPADVPGGRRAGAAAVFAGPHAAVAGAARADVRAGRARAGLLGPGGRGEGFAIEVGGAAQPPVRARGRPLPRARAGRAELLLPPALRDRDRRGPGAGLRPTPAGATPATAASRPGPARTPSGCTPAGPCPGRFDVSGGWYDAGDHGKYVTSGAIPAVAAARHRRADPPARRRAPLVGADRGAAARGVPLAARLAAADAGAARPARTPAWRSTACTAASGRRCPAGRTRTRPKRVLHRPSTAATLQLAAAAAHGARRVPRRARVRGAAARGRRHRLRGPRRPSRCSSPPTTRARSAAARTTTTTSSDDFARGPRPSCGSPPAMRPTEARRAFGRSTSTAST